MVTKKQSAFYNKSESGSSPCIITYRPCESFVAEKEEYMRDGRVSFADPGPCIVNCLCIISA